MGDTTMLVGAHELPSWQWQRGQRTTGGEGLTAKERASQKWDTIYRASDQRLGYTARGCNSQQNTGLPKGWRKKKVQKGNCRTNVDCWLVAM